MLEASVAHGSRFAVLRLLRSGAGLFHLPLTFYCQLSQFPNLKCSTSLPGGNQVDGLPPVVNTEAGLS